MELEDRYLVLKKVDIEAALTPYELHIFQRMVACIGEYRTIQGKSENKYVVINQDEPYFPDVLKLMEKQEQEIGTLKYGYEEMIRGLPPMPAPPDLPMMDENSDW